MWLPRHLPCNDLPLNLGGPAEDRVGPRIQIPRHHRPRHVVEHRALLDLSPLGATGRVLDTVIGSLDGLSPKVSAADRMTLENHADKIRALEMQLGNEGQAGAGCTTPMLNLPGDYDTNPYGSAWDANRDDVSSRVLIDLMVMALACDLTRVGTLQYTNCWGIATDADNKEGAKSLVEFLTTTQQQLAFSKAFGVMPSLQSASADFKKDNPGMEPFIDGAAYAQNLPAQEGVSDVLAELNSKLAKLKNSDPKAILDSTQTDLQAAIGG